MSFDWSCSGSAIQKWIDFFSKKEKRYKIKENNLNL
jgi:hypothetical protein